MPASPALVSPFAVVFGDDGVSQQTQRHDSVGSYSQPLNKVHLLLTLR